MRFHEIDPWQTWKERLERERLLEPPAELPFTSAMPGPDTGSLIFGQQPSGRALKFPIESEAVD
jgi:hypothetical protein